MSEIERIAKLLAGGDIEKQIAAAIVLGELRAKSPTVMEGLRKLIHSEVPPVAKNALLALSRIGAKRFVKEIFPLLTTGHGDVRTAAVQAIASVGPDVVPTIRARMAEALPDERRVLDGILAELGGEDAFSTLLGSLDTSDDEAAKAAAMAVRHEVKRADAKQRRRYVAQTEKFLHQKRRPSDAAIAAALKILGYLEDQRALPTLIGFAKDKKTSPAARQEALLAIRFVAPLKKTPAEVLNLLFDIGEAPDRALAHNALHTLATMELPARLLKRLVGLASHPELDRAQIAIEQLGRQPGVDAAVALVEIVATVERRRAEFAAQGLKDRPESAPALAQALLAAEDHDRAWLLRNVLRPMAKELKPAVLGKLRESALTRLSKGEPGWEGLFDIARDGNAKLTSEALRELGVKLTRSKKTDRALTVWRLLSKTDHADPDDLYKLASLELVNKSRLDTASRGSDESLKFFRTLVDRGFDVASALRKDRSVENNHLYYVGFHFCEAKQPLGPELLEEVVKKGGRTKLAKMAKNKLALASDV